MAERLVVISDTWGAKKGIWANSYLVYLQQYFNLTYLDSQRLAKLDLDTDSEETIHTAFFKGGIDTAVGELVKLQKEPCHYLAFGIGATIAWKAGLKGLPMKSLYAISPKGIHQFNNAPKIPTRLLFGDLDAELPTNDWFFEMHDIKEEIIESYGHRLYANDAVIKKVSKDLLSLVTHKIESKPKVNVTRIKKPLLVS